MQQFSNEQMRTARKTDLYEFLIRNHTSEIIWEGNSVRLRTNKSISVKKGYAGYRDFATDETGNSVDLLVRHLGYQLDEAVQALTCEGTMILSGECKAQKSIGPEFPVQTTGSFRQLFAYLMSRGIPAATIKWFVDQKLLYQSQNKNNAVFINWARDWAELRGTYTYSQTGFYGTVPNSRVDGFWGFCFGKNAGKAYICEGAIDVISLYLLHRNTGITDSAYYLSVGGSAKQPAIDRIKKQTHAILAVDNDLAGSKCRERNPELDAIVPTLKDWNDDWNRYKSSVFTI